MENSLYDLSLMSESDLEVCGKEIDSFLYEVWVQVGDTEFNRSGLRNATDILIDYLCKKEYYSTWKNNKGVADAH
tara:strand:+ start:5111 stop:5335 length:225 start_codon:yes stop_codon:yes gene_type:complete